MTGYGAGDAFTAVAQATKDGSQVQQAGELVMALLTSIAVLVSALMVFVSLCLQAVIVYLASAVFAVGWVWIVTRRHRERRGGSRCCSSGWCSPRRCCSSCSASRWRIAAAATAMTGDGVAKNLGLIVMACAAMLLAAFAPLILLKHAPVIPGTSTSREADGITGGGAARAGRDAGTAARGGRQAAQRGEQAAAPWPARTASAGSGRRGRWSAAGNAPAAPQHPPTEPGRTAGVRPAGPGARGPASGTTRAGRPNPSSSSRATAPGRRRHRSPPAGPGNGSPGTGSSRPVPSGARAGRRRGGHRPDRGPRRTRPGNRAAADVERRAPRRRRRTRAPGGTRRWRRPGGARRRRRRPRPGGRGPGTRGWPGPAADPPAPGPLRSRPGAARRWVTRA